MFFGPLLLLLLIFILIIPFYRSGRYGHLFGGGCGTGHHGTHMVHHLPGINCPSCKSTISGSYKFCPFCQTALQKSCPKCGMTLNSEWKYCPHCGS